MLKRLVVLAVLGMVLALAVPSFAQLPAVIEGFQNPVIVGGGSYLREDPGPGVRRVNLFLTSNVPGIKVGDIPLYVGGVGVTGGALDPSLADVQFGVSIPIVTYAPGSGQFVLQAGYTKLLTGAQKPDGFYGGVGFSLTSPKKLAYKRAVKAAKKAGKPLPTCEP